MNLASKKKALLEASQRELSLSSSLEQKKGFAGRLAEIHVDGKIAFPMSEEDKAKLSSSLATLEDLQKQWDGLFEEKERIDAKIEAYRVYEKQVETLLFEAHREYLYKQYKKAREILQGVPALSEGLEGKETSKVVLEAEEIAEWTIASLYKAEGEANLSLGRLPLSEEDVNAFYLLCFRLPLLLHEEASRTAMINVALSFAYVRAERSIQDGISTKETFLSYVPMLEDYNKRKKTFSPRCKSRGERFYQKMLFLFNMLCEGAFVYKRDYEECLLYFQHRDLFRNKDLANQAYKEAVDELDFRNRFIVKEGEGKDDKSFASDFLYYCNAYAEKQEHSIPILAHILSSPTLSSSKFDAALGVLQSFGLTPLLEVFDACLDLGLPKERQEEFFALLRENADPSLDLEDSAKSLLYLKQKVDPSLEKQVLSFLADIRRSPKAHLVLDRSSNPDVYALFGKTEVKPYGPPLKNHRVPVFSKNRLLFHWLLMVFIPLMLISVVTLGLRFHFPDNRWWNLLFLIPMGMVYLSVSIACYFYGGYQGRASVYCRRVYGILFILVSSSSLVYFIVPGLFPSIFKESMYFALLHPALLFLWGYVSAKEKSKAWNFFTYGLGFLILLAAVLTWIYDMANGIL